MTFLTNVGSQGSVEAPQRLSSVGPYCASSVTGYLPRRRSLSSNHSVPERTKTIVFLFLSPFFAVLAENQFACMKHTEQVARRKLSRNPLVSKLLSEFLRLLPFIYNMLICLIGPAKSGKNSLAEHLTTTHDFTRVHLSSQPPLSDSSSSLYFDSSNDFLDHVTRSWRRNYVTTDLTHRGKLEEFSKRPFVAVVAVDAPLGVRYKRAIAV